MNTSLPEPGDRVEMTGTMPDDPAPLPVGTTGTVTDVRPEVGQIFVDWDVDRTLILLASDPYRVI